MSETRAAVLANTKNDLTVTAVTDAAAQLNLKADQSNEDGDRWSIKAADGDGTNGGSLTINNEVSGSAEAMLTIDPSTGASASTTTVAGDLLSKVKIYATTKALAVSDSGSFLVPSAGTAQTFTLPAVATAAGCKFVFIAASAQAHVITCAANKIQGHILDASNGSTLADTAVANKNKITLANPEIGDRLEFVGDGTNYYVSGILNDTPTLGTA